VGPDSAYRSLHTAGVWTEQPRPRHPPGPAWPRTGLGRPEPAYRRIEQPGPRHPPGPLLTGRPAAVGSGPGRNKENDTDQSWMERVEGGGYCEPNRAGPGRADQGALLCESRLDHSHCPCYRLDTAPVREYPFLGKRCGWARVCFEGSPNSSYNEFICYTNAAGGTRY
jgi:hypothetical protein